MNFSLSNFDPQITISTAEMLEISQKINRDFAPVLSAQIDNTANPGALSSQQLLDISEHISLDFAPKVIHNSPQLMLLPVDPNNTIMYIVNSGQCTGKVETIIFSTY